MERIWKFSDAVLGEKEKIEIGLMVSKRELDSSQWDGKFPDALLLNVCKRACQERRSSHFGDEEKLLKFIDDQVEKKMRSIPGKQNAVFPLIINNLICGTAFAFDSCRVLSARRNLFTPTEAAAPRRTHILHGTELVEMEVELSPNPANGAALPDTEDWIILRRCDRLPFRTTIIIVPTDGDFFAKSRPRVTIYHYPESLTTGTNAPYNVLTSRNRIIGAHSGRLSCNDSGDISVGSCGGPYVDDVSGGAYGFHINDERESNAAVKATNIVPGGFHFHVESTLVAALKELNVLY